jgi:hypothetical protein
MNEQQQWPGQPGQPPGQPAGYPGQPPSPQPGYPAAYPPPADYPPELKSLAIFQIVAGGVAALIGLPFSFAMVVGATMGIGVFLAPLWIFGFGVAVLEIINGIKTLTGKPYRRKFWWLALPIMAICAVLVSDWLSLVAGIWALVLVNKPHIKQWLGWS